MNKIEVHPSEMSAWYALVEKARQSSTIQLNDELQSYLVFLLMRFMKEPAILSDALALEYLANIHKNYSQNLKSLREVGDKCLLLTGLFPERAKQRRVEISYYVKLGQSAYSTISEYDKTQLSRLYGTIGQKFVGLMDVLHAMRTLEGNHLGLDLLQAEDLFSTHQSPQALKILQQNTQGFFIPRSGLDSTRH